MTKNNPVRTPVPILVAALVILFSGCGREAEVFPEPDGDDESARLLRSSDSGCVLAVFSPHPPARGVPPDGVCRSAVLALERRPGSAAFFYWSRQDLAERWIRAQLAARRNGGAPRRLILAGHGTGGAAAAELARSLLLRETDLEIVLLLTVDAVKTDRLSATAGAAGSALVSRIPGLNVNFAAYDAAPLPDRRRLWSHVNYYQNRSSLCRGVPMPGAENHLVEDGSGLLNHGNIDDFILPLLAADLRAALEKAAP